MHLVNKQMQIQTVDDLIRILQEHPEWRDRLRDVLFTEEERRTPDRLREMQEVLQQLLESHRQAIARLERLEQSHEQLWESHRQAIARLERLEQSHEQLWESHRQAIARLDKLEESHRKLLESHEQLRESHEQLRESHEQLRESHEQLRESHEQLWESHRQAIARLDKLEESHRKLLEEVRTLREVVERLVQWATRADAQLNKLRGEVLELKFHQRAAAILGYYVRRPKVVNLADLLNRLLEEGHEFTQSEWSQLTAIDTLVSAKHPETGEQIYIAVEVSCMILPEDVERISQRARMLTARGVPTYAMVAGEGMVPEVTDLAEREGVLVLLDGAAWVASGTWLERRR